MYLGNAALFEQKSDGRFRARSMPMPSRSTLLAASWRIVAASLICIWICARSSCTRRNLINMGKYFVWRNVPFKGYECTREVLAEYLARRLPFTDIYLFMWYTIYPRWNPNSAAFETPNSPVSCTTTRCTGAARARWWSRWRRGRSGCRSCTGWGTGATTRCLQQENTACKSRLEQLWNRSNILQYILASHKVSLWEYREELHCDQVSGST